MSRLTPTFILIVTFLISFSAVATPVKNFLNPEPSATGSKKNSSETRVKSKASDSQESPASDRENPNPEKKENLSDDKGETVRSRVSRRSKTSKIEDSPKSAKTFENSLPNVSNLPARVAYDASKENPDGSGHGKGIPVLCYHHLADNGNPMGGYNLDPSLLEEQFKYLKKLGYQTVSLDQFYSYIKGESGADFPKRPILLTFDDGSLTHKTVLVSLLKKYGFRASIFIYPSTISNPKYKFYMRWPDLKEALSSGVLDLGSHTLYHPKLPAMKRAEIRKQLRESKAILEAKTGHKVKDLAYPFGLFDVRVIEEAKEAGYRMAFTVNPGKNVPSTDPYTVHRSLIPWGQSQARFNSILSASPPGKIKLGIADGSWVKPGQAFSVNVEGLDPATIQMKIRGKNAIRSKKSATEYVVGVPDFKTKVSYPPLVITGKTPDGRRTETQFLFVNRQAFNREPD